MKIMGKWSSFYLTGNQKGDGNTALPRTRFSVALPEWGDGRIREAILRLGRASDCSVQVVSFLNAGESPPTSSEYAHCRFIKPGEMVADATRFLQARARSDGDHRKIGERAGNFLVQAGILLAQGEVACTIAGAASTTADVIRAALASVGTAPGIRTVSGAFLMQRPSESLLFADAGVVIAPTADELCDTAMSSVETFKVVCPGIEPNVAFLSFSTRGSAPHADSDKVKQATNLFREKCPGVNADGELQFDAAYVPQVRERKAPDSPLRGAANIYVFPDLDAGNIGYKIAQRLGGFTAIGPILQGLNKPYSDLSRGASVEEIIDSVFLNALR